MNPMQQTIALVTGAGSGIGQAVAAALAAGGATVMLVGRDEAKLATTAAALRAAGAAADPVLCRADLTVDAEVEALAAGLRARHGRLDILVHSAALLHPGAQASQPVAELDAQYRANLRAPFLLTQQLLPLLKINRGQIVFVNSSAIQHPAPQWGAYAATKAGLKALADSLRAEVNGDGVRVLSIYPGRTASPMQAALHRLEGKPYRPERLLQPQDVAATLVHALGLPRTAEVTDLHIRPMQKG